MGDRITIQEVLSRINDAWLHKRGEPMRSALNSCFAEDAVLRGHDFALLGTGRQFIVQSFVDFVAQAVVHDFVAGEPTIDFFGDTATAQYEWTMTYERNGQRCSERGHDIYLLRRTSDRWLVCWRAMLLKPN